MDKDKLRAKIDQVLSGELSEDVGFPEVGGKKYMESLGVDPEWAATSLSSATDDQGLFISASYLTSLLILAVF